MFLLTAFTVVCIVIFEHDKVGDHPVWSTFFVQGFLLYGLVVVLANIDSSKSLELQTKPWSSLLFMKTRRFIVESTLEESRSVARNVALQESLVS
jgi:hypothetical protein